MKFLSKEHLWVLMFTAISTALFWREGLRAVDILMLYGILLANARALMLEKSKQRS